MLTRLPDQESSVPDIRGGELGLGLIGFGGAKAGVEVERFPPVVAGLDRVAVGLAGAGEAAMRACLFQWRASFGCEPERVA
jgi:hypothetical protein